MPNLIQFLTSGLGKTVVAGTKGAWRLGTGKYTALPARIALGSTIGGISRAVSNDYNSSTMQFGAIAKGAVFGALLGGATWGVPKAAMGAWKLNQKMGGGKFSASPAASFLRGVRDLTGRGKYSGAPARALGRGVARVGWSALENPGLALAGVGAVAGGLAYMNRDTPSPTMQGTTLNANYNQQAIAAEQLQMNMISPTGMVGSAPQMMGRMNRSMMQSTYGLTQGLHRGRHGG